VKPSELVSYEDLADPKWKGRLCLRTSKKVYNQSARRHDDRALGEAETARVVGGWVANLATEPFANDNQVMEAIDAASATSHREHLLLRPSRKERPGLKVAIAWPNQASSGSTSTSRVPE